MKQLQYDLLFRWYVDLGTDDPVWVEEARKSVHRTELQP